MKPKKKNKKTIKVKKRKKKPVVGYYFDGKKTHTLYEDHWSTKNGQIYRNNVRNICGLFVMGDRHYTYDDGMAILVVVDGLPRYAKINYNERLK